MKMCDLERVYRPTDLSNIQSDASDVIPKRRTGVVSRCISNRGAKSRTHQMKIWKPAT